MKRLNFKRVIFLCLALLIGVYTYQNFYPKEFTAHVEKVLDGDTIIVDGMRIRLAGIDAPELDQHSFDKKPIGLWSREYLRKYIENKKVTILWKRRGKYGRIIGEVFYQNKSVNELLLINGMALSYFDYKSFYSSMEFDARLKRVGIFKTFGFYKPSFFRKKKRSKKER